jgi:bifunctional DNA-binding transcriptional regulator/antitoxin component of YhaV-PrlF toxin-antitoxin module
VWRRRVFRHGDSLAIVIPARVHRSLGIRVGQRLVITVTKSREVKMRRLKPEEQEVDDGRFWGW